MGLGIGPWFKNPLWFSDSFELDLLNGLEVLMELCKYRRTQNGAVECFTLSFDSAAVVDGWADDCKVKP